MKKKKKVQNIYEINQAVFRQTNQDYESFDTKESSV